MSKIESSAGKALYEQQETKLSQQSAAFIELLTKRGILGDSSIDDDRVRQAKKEKKKSMYHNTLLLLQHYRTILWTLECFPSSVAEELDRPLICPQRMATRAKSKRCVRERMVSGSFCGSVVAKMNTRCAGGSSSVFRSAANASPESWCTSSMMTTR